MKKKNFSAPLIQVTTHHCSKIKPLTPPHATVSAVIFFTPKKISGKKNIKQKSGISLFPLN